MWLADNELITMSNVARKFLPHEMKMRRRTAIKVTLSQTNCCRGTVQPRKWQLTGIDCSTVAHRQPIAGANGQLGPQYADSRHTAPQSAMLGLHPVIHVPNYIDHYSFTDP